MAALAVADWRMAVLALLGAASSTAASRLLGSGLPELRSGDQGFCGALVGAAAFSVLAAEPLAYLVAVAGGAVCAPLTASVRWLFRLPALRPLCLPSTTAPFCMVAVTMSWLTAGAHAAAGLPNPQGPAEWQFLRSLLTNISEVVFLNSAPAGVLILAALFLARRRLAAAALLGSAVASVFALAVGAGSGELGSGLLGYSAVLTSMALAVVFLHGRWTPWLLALAGSLLAAAVTALMNLLPGPVFTWPYVVSTWLMLVAVHLVPQLRVLRIR